MHQNRQRSNIARIISNRLIVVAAFLFVLVAIGLPRIAPAQGTDGSLPDPISTAELMGYADRLRLSDQQREAMLPLHDRYKNEFRQLREGPIAEFMRTTGEMQGTMPDRETAEKFIKQMSDLNNRISTLDRRLFDHLMPMLTEEQLTILPRVRLERERTRYLASQMLWMAGRPPVDLSRTIRSVELDDAARVRADSVIATYERQLTKELGELSDRVSSFILDMLDAMAEAGFANRDMRDIEPDEMQKMMETMQQIFRTLRVRIMEQSKQIDELNERTYRNVAATLPANEARRFRNAYYSEAYPALAGLTGVAYEDSYDRVMKLLDLDPATKEEIEAVVADARVKLDQILERALPIARKLNDGAMEFGFGGPGEEWQSAQEELTKLQTEGHQLVQKATVSINELLGPEGMKKVQEAHMAEMAEAGGIGAPIEVVRAGDAEIAQSDDEDDASHMHSWTGDHYLPRPISRGDVSRYARRLGLEDGMRDVLRASRNDYAEQFDDLAVIEKLKEANQNFWTYDHATNTSVPPSREKIDRVRDLRLKALSEIETLEDRFFNDLKLTVDQSKHAIIDRLRSERLRRTLSQGQSWGGGFGRSAEGGIDLTALLARLDLDEHAMQEVDVALDTYSRELTSLMRTRFAVQIEHQHAMDGWNTVMQSHTEEDGMPDFQQYQEIVQPIQNRLEKANEKIVELNRSAIAALEPLLSAEAQRELWTQHNKQAYPDIFQDALAIDAQLTAAAKLSSLTPDQQERVNELLLDYRPEYDRLCQAMVDIRANGGLYPTDWQNADMEAYQKRRESMAKIQFERSELNQRIAARLKLILTDEQQASIGGLPEPVDHRMGIYY